MTGDLAPGDLLAGKYRIERALGRGGMGAVFLAENIDIGRKVAIKVLLPERAGDPSVVQRFRQEARAAAAIGHPGIVEILDLGRTEEGAEFIVMEHLRGETLESRLQRQARLPVPLALELALRILDALQAAHARGIVHRDLKPENVFLVEGGLVVKILDFGISKLVGTGEQLVRTASGVVMGTPLYMPPEQATGNRDLGPPADLYALGAILYRMLAGEPPLVAEFFAALLLKVVQEVPRPVEQLREGLPPGLGSVVGRLLAKNPAERPAAPQLRAELRKIVESLPASPLEDTLPPEGELALGRTEPPPSGETPARDPRPAPVDRGIAPAAAATELAVARTEPPPATGPGVAPTELPPSTGPGVVSRARPSPSVEDAAPARAAVAPPEAAARAEPVAAAPARRMSRWKILLIVAVGATPGLFVMRAVRTAGRSDRAAVTRPVDLGHRETRDRSIDAPVPDAGGPPDVVAPDTASRRAPKAVRPPKRPPKRPPNRLPPPKEQPSNADDLVRENPLPSKKKRVE